MLASSLKLLARESEKESESTMLNRLPALLGYDFRKVFIIGEHDASEMSSDEGERC